MRHPPETRARAIALYRETSNVRAVARQLGLPYATVYRWTHPEFAERSRRVSRAWKSRNARRVRDYDRMRTAERVSA